MIPAGPPKSLSILNLFLKTVERKKKETLQQNTAFQKTHG